MQCVNLVLRAWSVRSTFGKDIVRLIVDGRSVGFIKGFDLDLTRTTPSLLRSFALLFPEDTLSGGLLDLRTSALDFIIFHL